MQELRATNVGVNSEARVFELRTLRSRREEMNSRLSPFQVNATRTPLFTDEEVENARLQVLDKHSTRERVFTALLILIVGGTSDVMRSAIFVRRDSDYFSSFRSFNSCYESF